MKFIVIVPARSGSVGVKDKNIKKIHGQSLLERAIRTGLTIAEADNIIISSDSDRYLSQAYECHPLLNLSKRPDCYSSSNSSILDTVEYELLKFKHLQNFDYVVLLEPSHFGKRENIPYMLKVFSENKFDFGLGVYLVPEKYNYEKQIIADQNFELKHAYTISRNRQDLTSTFIRSGEFYVFRPELFLRNKSFFEGKGRVFVTNQSSVNIDTIHDLQIAKKLQI